MPSKRATKEITKQTKICMVPACEAINSDVPDRIFFAVPENKKKKWMKKCGGDITSISPNQRLFCCEKHFNVKKDIVAYDFYKVFGGGVKLEDHAYPYKNVGDNIVVSPPKRRNVIITEILKPKEKSPKEQCVEQVDPIPIFEDKYAENVKEDESNSDANDTTFNHVDSGFDDYDTSPMVRSEEIFVTSDVYDDDDNSDSDDIPLKMLQVKTVGDTNSDTKLIESDLVDTATNSQSIKYNCQECNKILSSSRSLKRHTKFFHRDVDNSEEHSCKECHETFITLENYKKHKLVHKQLEYNCQKCGKHFSWSRSLKRHALSCHIDDSDMKEDPTSQIEIRSQPNTDDESNDKGLSCRVCSRTFTSRDDYVKHKIIHKKTFECDTCQKVFRTRRHLIVHFPIHMNIKPYLCEICSKSFARTSNLRRHRLTHVDVKKCVCDICGKRFSANYLLTKHIKSHSDNKSPRRSMNQKPNTDCDDCKITLNCPYRLKLHRLRLHNPDNPFNCDICKQTFPEEMLKNKHVMRTHSPEYEYIYKCVMCPKKYVEEAALKRHLKLHTDVKRTITCELCDKTLSRRNRLLPHMRALHNPNNPFKCPICQQTFRDEKILDNHTIKVHDRTNECQFCSKSYSDHRRLQNHVQMFHSNKKSNQSE